MSKPAKMNYVYDIVTNELVRKAVQKANAVDANIEGESKTDYMRNKLMIGALYDASAHQLTHDAALRLSVGDILLGNVDSNWATDPKVSPYVLMEQRVAKDAEHGILLKFGRIDCIDSCGKVGQPFWCAAIEEKYVSDAGEQSVAAYYKGGNCSKVERNKPFVYVGTLLSSGAAAGLTFMEYAAAHPDVVTGTCSRKRKGACLPKSPKKKKC